MEVKEISTREAINFLLPRHYSGRIPSISKAYWWYNWDRLMAVCTFGKPASPSLCVWVCGKEYSKNVYELNRLCREEDLKKQLSEFVWECLRRLKEFNWIIVSYSDTAMNHHWYIYQACNFIYTWATRERTDMFTPNWKHSRHYKIEQQTWYRKVRSSKHRYICFCTHSDRLKKLWLNQLRYKIERYPKWDNSNYKLWEYLQDKIIKNVE